MNTNIQKTDGNGNGRSQIEVFRSLDKRTVFDKFKGVLDGALQSMEKSTADTRQRARDAPGAMQSHHDTSKKELGWLIDGLSKREAELRARLNQITEFSDKVSSFFSPGAMALVQINKSSEVYVLLPGGEGTPCAP